MQRSAAQTTDAKPPRGNAGPSAETGRRVVEAEAAAVRAVAEHIGAGFDRAVERLKTLEGSLVVSGLGKSGLVGAKLSATFSSVGTPSHFMHPTEAVHGDLGRMRPGDAVLLLSYSGTTDELLSLAALLRQDRVPIFSITKDEATRLGELSDFPLAVGTVEEACPHNLAPTASTAAMLALGDALALAVSSARNFSADDFHRAHPGGALGRNMLPVVDVLRFKVPETLTPLSESATVAELVAHKPPAGVRRSGATLLVDDAGTLTGVFTDGDLRRVLATRGEGVLGAPVSEVMTRSPKTLGVEARVRDAVQLVRETRIDEIPIVDEKGAAIGLLDVQDLVALKVIE